MNEAAAAAGLELVVISGPSGAGKTTVAKAFEDLGWFCVDNMPVALLPRFVELCLGAPQPIPRAALVIDVREREFLGEVPQAFREAEALGVVPRVLFLETADDVLASRFRETRRQHPLGLPGGVREGIERERVQLAPIRDRAVHVVDTSGYTIHELRQWIVATFAEPGGEKRMVVRVQSFGFRYGIPLDADLVMDVRFLPNPNYVEKLRERDGNDPEVERYVTERGETASFVARLVDLVRYLLPCYQREGKSFLTVAVGCTGGRHRSVVVANALAGGIEGMEGIATEVRHRDVKRES